MEGIAGGPTMGQPLVNLISVLSPNSRLRMAETGDGAGGRKLVSGLFFG